MLTCIHAPAGLCERCQADYEADPAAYIEFGDHPEGVVRWEAEQARIDRDLAGLGPWVPPGPEVPY